MVLGAGASHDSISIVPERHLDERFRPPVAKDLFSGTYRLRNYLSNRPALQSLAAAIGPRVRPDGANFEQILTDEFDRASGNPVLRRGFTALRFYLRDLFRESVREWSQQVGGATNLAWLVGSIERWRGRVNGYVLWITFNYDLLLDEALEALYGPIEGFGGSTDPSLGGYVAHPDWALIKLHGSCDWSRRTNLELRPEQGINDNFAGYDALVHDWDAERDSPNSRTVYVRGGGWDADSDRVLRIPAIMVPLATGKRVECPPAHFLHLINRLKDVDLIFSVGWQAQDQHFLDVIGEMRVNPPDVLALTGRGPASANAVRDRIGAAIRPGGSVPGLLVSDRHAGLSARVDDNASRLEDEIRQSMDEARSNRQRRAANSG